MATSGGGGGSRDSAKVMEEGKGEAREKGESKVGREE